MYLAKPNTLNFNDSQIFHDMKSAKKYLDSFFVEDEDVRNMTVEDWCMLEKILEVRQNGSYAAIQIDEEEYFK